MPSPPPPPPPPLIPVHRPVKQVLSTPIHRPPSPASIPVPISTPEIRRQPLNGTGVLSAFYDSKCYRCNICKYKSITRFVHCLVFLVSINLFFLLVHHFFNIYLLIYSFVINVHFIPTHIILYINIFLKNIILNLAKIRLIEKI